MSHEWRRAARLRDQDRKEHAEQRHQQADDREAAGEHVRVPSRFRAEQCASRAEPAPESAVHLGFNVIDGLKPAALAFRWALAYLPVRRLKPRR